MKARALVCMTAALSLSMALGCSAGGGAASQDASPENASKDAAFDADFGLDEGDASPVAAEASGIDALTAKSGSSEPSGKRRITNMFVRPRGKTSPTTTMRPSVWSATPAARPPSCAKLWTTRPPLPKLMSSAPSAVSRQTVISESLAGVVYPATTTLSSG